MKEIWKDIDNYEGLYQISNFGNIKSLNYNGTKKEKELKQIPDKDGYMKIGLCKNNILKEKKIHRLVVEAYLNKKKFKYTDKDDKLKYINNLNKLEVNHKDENKQNNNLDNLEWCTHSYNNNYGSKNKTISKKVNQYDLNGNYIKTWDSLYKVQKEIGIHVTNISRCCRNIYKTSGGFIWKYAGKED